MPHFPLPPPPSSFRNNCNNFTSEAARFLCGTDIPERILAIPRIVMATPMGAMIGSMMSGMNERMGSAGSGGATDPFTALAGSAWQGASTSATAAAPSSTTTSRVPTSPAATAAASAAPPLDDLSAMNKPMLFRSSGNVSVLVKRLLKANEGLPEGSPHVLTREDVLALELLPALLSAMATPTASSSPSGAPPPPPEVSRVVPLLSRLLREWPHGVAAFAVLALLRLCVLRADAAPLLFATGSPSAAADSAASSNVATDGVMWDILEALGGASSPSSSTASHSYAFGSAKADVMALSVLVNAWATGVGAAWATGSHRRQGKGQKQQWQQLGQNGGASDSTIANTTTAAPSSVSVPELLVTIAIRAISSPSSTSSSSSGGGKGGAADSVEHRQLGAALAFNLCLQLACDSDVAVSVADSSTELLIALLDGIDSESDAETVRRRLAGAGKLVQREGPAVGALAATLGLDASVAALLSPKTGPLHPPAVRTLANQVLRLLQPMPEV